MPPLFRDYVNLSGGLVTAKNPTLLNQNPQQGPVQFSQATNIDLFKLGAVRKRKGKTQQGESVISNTTFSNTTYTTQSNSGFLYGYSASFAQKIVPASNFTVSSFSMRLQVWAGSDPSIAWGLYGILYADSSGSPGSALATTSIYAYQSSGNQASPAVLNFAFTSPYTITAGTTYWVAVTAVALSGTVGYDLGASYNASGTTDWLYKINNNPVWSSPGSGNGDLYCIVYGSAASTYPNGLFDYKPQTSGVLSQNILAAFGGQIYKANAVPLIATTTWTSIASGLNASNNAPYDFCTLKNLCFVCDYGNTNPVVWDGSSTGMMKHGYQTPATLTAQSSGSLAAGTYNVMFVTTLTSGGYRVSGPFSCTVSASGKIAVTALAINSSTDGTQFAFDIGSAATQVFMTDGTTGATTSGIYYAVPAANMGSVPNPMPNSTTAVTITSVSNLTAAETLLDAYSLPQAYFTSQGAAPKAKFFENWQNMLCAAGDPTHPSRVWFSEAGAPQNIGSTYGGTQGDYVDFNVDDGDIITGMCVFYGNLMVFKNNSIFRVSFTAANLSPFQVTQVQTDFGALSHWYIKQVPDGVVFISQRGLVMLSGNPWFVFANLLPEGENIRDYFDSTNSSSFNLGSMAVGTAAHYSSKEQVWFMVSSNGATTRDTVLVWDYTAHAVYLLDAGIASNYAANVSANTGSGPLAYTQVWTLDNSGNVFLCDSGTSDNGSAITFTLQTPRDMLDAPEQLKQLEFLWVRGVAEASGTLYYSVYLDGSATPVVSSQAIDLTQVNLTKGIYLPISGLCYDVSVEFANSDASSSIEIDALRIQYDLQGPGV